jgi:hypothetical protein
VSDPQQRAAQVIAVEDDLVFQRAPSWPLRTGLKEPTAAA